MEAFEAFHILKLKQTVVWFLLVTEMDDFKL